MFLYVFGGMQCFLRIIIYEEGSHALYFCSTAKDCTTTDWMWWELRHPIEELLVCDSTWEELFVQQGGA